MFKFFFLYLHLRVFSFNFPFYPLWSFLLPPLSSGVLPLTSFILWGLTLSHYILSCSTVSHYILLCSTISYRVPLYPTISYHVRRYPIVFNCIPLYPIVFDGILSCSTVSHYILSCSTVSHYILSCSTVSYGVPLYPMVFHCIISYPTISYGVPLYPIVSTLPISWIIHVSHALIYNVIFLFFFLENRFNARLGIRSGVSGSEVGGLHHYTIATGLERYIFWGVFKPILLPKRIKKKTNITNWNTFIKETRKILKIIYTNKRLLLPSLNQLFNLQNKQIYVLYFLQFTCSKPHSCSP